MSELFQSIYNGLIQTTPLEAVAVIMGIVSVWYSRKENILVYPTGLINTTLYIYLSYKGHLLGEASVNLYYTIMRSILYHHELVWMVFVDQKNAGPNKLCFTNNS